MRPVTRTRFVPRPRTSATAASTSAVGRACEVSVPSKSTAIAWKYGGKRTPGTGGDRQLSMVPARRPPRMPAAELRSQKPRAATDPTAPEQLTENRQVGACDNFIETKRDELVV